MKTSAATLGLLALFCFNAAAADSAGWAGEYTDKKFLNGRAVFQLSIEQSGSIRFDAAWNDGHAAAPEAEGPGKISASTLTFKWEDSFKNSAPAPSPVRATTLSCRSTRPM